MPFVEDSDVIQKLSAKAADHAFNIRILPGRGRRRDDLVDTEGLNPSSYPVAINTVAVTQQITRRGIEWKRFNPLLSGPLCRGMFCHIEVDDVPSVMGQSDEHEQHLERCRRHDEEVDCNKFFQV